jgi:hypothetical protein
VNWLSGIEDVITNVTPNQTLLIEEGSTLSISEFSASNLVVTPNPTQGKVSIKNMTESLEVEVLDNLGRLILSKQISKEDNSIDMSSNSKGIYLLRLKGETSEIVKKIVLN